MWLEWKLILQASWKQREPEVERTPVLRLFDLSCWRLPGAVFIGPYTLGTSLCVFSYGPWEGKVLGTGWSCFRTGSRGKDECTPARNTSIWSKRSQNSEEWKVRWRLRAQLGGIWPPVGDCPICSSRYLNFTFTFSKCVTVIQREKEEEPWNIWLLWPTLNLRPRKSQYSSYRSPLCFLRNISKDSFGSFKYKSFS